MNKPSDFSVKKLAEVQAFILLSDAMLDRAHANFADAAPDVASALSELSVDLTPLIADAEQVELFKAKTARTLAKLESMMDLYIGNHWDDPVEILEWLSFYAGSASAHAELSAAAFGAADVKPAQDSAHKLSEIFWKLLETVKRDLVHIGAHDNRA